MILCITTQQYISVILVLHKSSSDLILYTNKDIVTIVTVLQELKSKIYVLLNNVIMI